MGTIPAPNIAELGGEIGRNPLQEYAQAQQLKTAALQQTALQQENQQRQLQLQDQQAMTKAMQSWDGQDINALPDLMRKAGISGPGYMNAQQAILQRKQQLQPLDKGALD